MAVKVASAKMLLVIRPERCLPSGGHDAHEQLKGSVPPPMQFYPHNTTVTGTFELIGRLNHVNPMVSKPLPTFMLKYRSILLSAVVLCTPPLLSQTGTIRGTVVDDESAVPMPNVTIRRIDAASRTTMDMTRTISGGIFSLPNVPFGQWLLKATYIGYDTLLLRIDVSSRSINLGTLRLTQGSIPMSEVVVRGIPPPVEQIGDTTQFYADAFAVNKDANAEDLVAKMPGVTVEGTSVQSQGEDIRQVLVDGKQFFSDDPMIALRNLPAEIIERVQVYDKLSDQAELTGFDDGESVRTMNIITRMRRRNGTFGKASGGYGTDAKYSGGLTTHIFNGEQRLSLFGISNNVNAQNFSMQDILGVMRNTNTGRGMFGGGRRRDGRPAGRFRPPGGGGDGRAGGMMPVGAMAGGMRRMGDFLVGEQNGLNTTHSLGVTFGDTWFEDLEINGNYFVNRSNNTGLESLDRQYVSTADSAQAYAEENDARSENTNHRFMLRMQYELDSMNTLIVNPRLNAQVNSSTDRTLGRNTLEGLLLNTSDIASTSATDGYTGSVQAIFRHRSDIPGRSLSFSARASASDRNGSGDLDASTLYPGSGRAPQTSLAQKNSSDGNSSAMSGNILYTEPLMVNGLIQLRYSLTRSRGTSVRTTLAFDSLTSDYTALQAGLSSDASTEDILHRGGVGFRYGSREGLRALVSLDIQRTTRTAELLLPAAEHISHTYDNILPLVTLSYRSRDMMSLALLYRTSTQTPSATQLQTAVDNSNPTQLTTGNPGLSETYTHFLTARFGMPNPQQMTSFFVTLMFSETRNAIVNSVLYPSRDTVLPGGLLLNQGSQLTTPVNIDGQRSIRAFVIYGFPIAFVGSNLNLSTGISQTRSPSLLNGRSNLANSLTLSQGVTLVSTFSREVDFTVSYTANYNRTTNTLLSAYDNTYYFHTAAIKATAYVWNGIVLRTDATHRYYSGLQNSFREDYVLWNASIGKKFFTNDQGELTLSVYDILRQNSNVSITSSDLYIETQTTNALRQYFLLTFSYTLRSF